jgi:hypothetical protein
MALWLSPCQSVDQTTNGPNDHAERPCDEDAKQGPLIGFWSQNHRTEET